MMAEYISLFWWGLFNHEEEVVVVNITEVEKMSLVNAHWNLAVRILAPSILLRACGNLLRGSWCGLPACHLGPGLVQW